MNKRIFTILLVLIVFCTFLTAENEGAGKIRLGAHIGYFSFSDSNNNIEPLNPDFLNGIFYGADAGFMITKHIELSASYTRISQEHDALTLTPPLPVEASYNEWYLGGYFHFMGIFKPINIKVGAGIDLGTVYAEINYGGDVIYKSDQNGLGFWLSAGVETAISNLFNVGAEVIYLSLETKEDNTAPGDEVDIGGIRIKGFVKIII
jgi:opacity protein-like surface antigen